MEQKYIWLWLSNHANLHIHVMIVAPIWWRVLRLIYKGLMNLANFVLSQSSKVLNELIDKHVKCKPLMRIFNAKKIENGCLSWKHKRWLFSRLRGSGWNVRNRLWEALRNNKVHLFVYAAAAIRDLMMINGREKFRNLMIIGRANCGKTFTFKPLASIYVVSKPANDKYMVWC